ncbi:uncharacterized protein [Nicotiana sylvestris]|uniref:uncharacterized protein n=1 Tax=Nicotiana sylvestris TaxID=4096 RepID=UPI00388CB64A
MVGPSPNVMLSQPGLRLSHPFTGTVSVCRDASVLFDPGSTYSYMSSYFSSYLVVPRDSFSAPMYVSTPVRDSIIVDHIYCSCVVDIGGLETRVDLLLLDMVNFDVILRIDWLSPYLTILDCHAKTAQCMVEKGCLTYLDYVRESSAEVLSMDSVPVVREFPEVFPVGLQGIPPDRDIDFYIDLARGTQPISILPYHMAPPELKEKLQNLLDKGFIRPSVSPWSAPVLFVKKKDRSMRMCIEQSHHQEPVSIAEDW